MLYHSAELPRDPATRGSRFGDTDCLHLDDINDTPVRAWGQNLIDGGVSLVLGTALQHIQDGPLVLPLVKLYERYPTRTGAPVYLERLCYREGARVHAFKVRYRTAEGVTSFVLHRNLKAIYTHLRTGPVEVDWNGADLTDPKILVAEAAVDLAVTPDLQDFFGRLVEALRRHAPPGVDLLTPEAYTDATALAHMDGFTRALTDVMALGHATHEKVKGLHAHLVRRFFIPALPVADPLTAAGARAALAPARLAGRYAAIPVVDTTPTPALEIADPHRTEFSPYHFRSIAEDLDTLGLTDFDVSYAVADFVETRSRVIRHAFDRYAGAFPDAERLWPLYLRLLDRIAHDAFTTADSALPDELVEEVFTRLRVRRTCNEEALFEFFTAERPTTPAYAVHLDLALLSLTSLGATDGSVAWEADDGQLVKAAAPPKSNRPPPGAPAPSDTASE